MIKPRFPRILLALPSLLLLWGCAQGTGSATAGDAKTPDAKPVAAAGVKTEITPKGPVGLFFMTRYSSFSHTLEKAAWYFTPEGEVYQNLQTGLSKEDLAAHKGPKGKFIWTEKEMEVTWSDGKKTKTGVERDSKDSPGFMWDMGIFTPTKPVDDPKTIVGVYEGGESLSHGGNAAAVSKSLELKADGTYAMEGVASLKGTTDKSVIAAGSQGQSGGTWKLDGYSLIFSGADGSSSRKIVFPYVDEKTFRLYVGGILYKRR